MSRVFLILLVCLRISLFSSNLITVESKIDDGEYSLGDYLITASDKESEISYYLRGDYIDIRYNNCQGKSDIELFKYHKLILDELIKEFKLSNFKTISWGGFSRNRDYTRSVKIALLSSKSELYQDYRLNYPNSKLKYLNDHFVDLCNKGEVYNDIKQLFKEYGADIELRSVEKVFTGRVENLSFKEELIKMGLNENDRVIFDSGMILFKIINKSRSQS